MAPPERCILGEFLAAGDSFVSGAAVARQLDTSRVSVWTQMEKLRAEGFEFEARPRRGYRLKKIPDRLSPSYLEAALHAARLDTPLFFHETLDSTNSEADRLLAAGQAAPFVLAARTQSRGRGRLGRAWFSNDEGSLFLSFAFAPGLPPARMQTFTLSMGVAIADYLAALLPSIQLKWPNDLLADGKKLGGMLTEARIDADRIRDLVFGLGINVNATLSGWPDEVKATATSISAARGEPVPLNPFTAKLVCRIDEAYREFVDDARRDRLHEQWSRFDALAGKTVSATHRGEPVRGRAEGIDREGRLLVRTSNGTLYRLNAGDVTLDKPTSTANISTSQ